MLGLLIREEYCFSKQTKVFKTNELFCESFRKINERIGSLGEIYEQLKRLKRTIWISL